MVRRILFGIGTLLLLIAAVGLVQAEFGGEVQDDQADELALQGGVRQAEPPQRRSLFEGLAGMVDSVDDSQMTDEQRELWNDQKAQLKADYRDADNAWRNMKADMNNAIRQMNRQVRVPNRTPNVILITADGLGIADLGIYRRDLAAQFTDHEFSAPTIKTPVLDALAETGIRFSNYYAGAPTSIPANASLATGMHTGHVSVRGSQPVMPLAADDVTLAEVMWYGGFRTGYVGAWSLGEPGTAGVPTLQGFDYAFGYLEDDAARSFYPTTLWRNGERVEFIGHLDGGHTVDAQTLLTQDALAFLDQQVPNRPFFLQIDFALPMALADEPRDTAAYDDMDWPLEAKQYASMVTEMDRDIGRIMERLYNLGLDNNTLVVFAGDVAAAGQNNHWEFFDSNGPYDGLPGALSEGSLRAPLIMSWPRRVPENAVSTEPCSACDILPTLAAMTGTWKLPRSLGGQAILDGDSLVQAFTGAPMGDRLLYWEQHDGGFAQAVRVGPWKATRAGINQPISLYNLADDPGEKTNLAADHVKLVERLGELMDDAHVEVVAWPAR